MDRERERERERERVKKKIINDRDRQIDRQTVETDIRRRTDKVRHTETDRQKDRDWPTE